MSKNSDVYKKWGVILIGLLFLGSMAGIAIDSSGRGSGNVDLPEQSVLSEDMTDEQRAAVYRVGGTVVVFESSLLCGFECTQVRSELEALTTRYDGYVYLVLIQSEGDMGISVGNYLEVASVDTVDDVEDKICEVLVRHPMCIERGAVAAVFNYNYTRVNESADDVNETAGNESEELIE